VRLTETLAEEVRPHNIQVNAVAPGAVNTRMLEEVLALALLPAPIGGCRRRARLKEGRPLIWCPASWSSWHLRPLPG